MIDQPSEQALRKACEVLGWNYRLFQTDDLFHRERRAVADLARHFDAEDKAARAALDICVSTTVYDFTHRHVLPDPKPALEDILRAHVRVANARLMQALRDAGLLREGV